MRIRKPLGLALLLAALAGASGAAWIPVPIGMAQSLLDERAPGFQLTGRARLRWGSGELRADGVSLRWRGQPVLEVAEITARLDLRPWARPFGRPWRMRLRGASIELDAERKAALASLHREPAAPVSLEVEVADARARWVDAEGRAWSGRIERARAIVRTGAAREAESAAEAELMLEAPAPAEVRLRARAVAGASAEASLVLRAPRALEFAALAPAFAGAEGAAALALHLHLGGDFLRCDARLDAAALRHPRLPATIESLLLTARGDLRRALRAECAATSGLGAVEASAWLLDQDGAAQLGPWRAEAQAQLRDCALDAELRRNLEAWAPIATRILEGLGLDGTASARLAASATLDASGSAADWRLAAAAPLAGLGLRYEGFADSSGQTFAFPYPGTLTAGTAAWSESSILIAAHGSAGEADGDAPGAVAAPAALAVGAALELAPQPGRLWLDLSAQDLRLDERLEEALAAHPPIAALWERLGRPRGLTDGNLSLRPGAGGTLDWSLRLRAADCATLPPDLDVALELATAEAVVDRGGARFAVECLVDGLALGASGSLRVRADRPNAAELALTVAGRGYPAAEARARLAERHGLPRAFREIELAGAPQWRCAARLPLGEDAAPPSYLVAAEVQGAAPSWPQRDAECEDWSARAAAVAAAGRLLVALAPAAGSWQEARFEIGGAAFLDLDDAAAPPAGSVTGVMSESTIGQAQVASALALLRAEPWATGLRFGGRSAAVVEVPLAEPAALRARLDLAPLHVVVQPGALGATAAREASRYMLSGSLRFDRGAFRTPRFALRAPDLDLVFEEAGGTLGAEGMRLRGTAVSSRGVVLRQHLAVVAPAPLLASFERIGLDGRVAPRRVVFDVDWPTGGTPRLQASGPLELAEFRLLGPPPVQGGAGEVECLSFEWRGPSDFRGSFRLEGGSAQVSGVRVHDASAAINLRPDRIVVSDFEAAALDGRAFTRVPAEDGGVHEGQFLLGLTGNAAIRAEFGFAGLLLERMGEELGYRGPLAGRLDGRVNLRSPDPSPLHYQGAARLQITDGVLGAVPVLSQLWRLLGVQAPVFREGSLALQFLGDGRLLVEELRLNHPLLEVTGERVITMDSYLRMKVTVRTFGLLGRLPLISHLMDLIVEQDVYGPAAAPRLRQRGLGKLFQGDPERVPFPLWVPRTPQPERTRSPLLPAGRVLAPRP